jgi:hypothetical protein
MKKWPGRVMRSASEAWHEKDPLACNEKVAGTCHSERSEESEVGHAARLVRPDASLPLILRFTQDDTSRSLSHGMP